MVPSRRKALYAGASVALALAAASIPGASFAQSNQEPIKLGFLSSFTGAANQSGFNGIVAVNLAVKEIDAGRAASSAVRCASSRVTTNPIPPPPSPKCAVWFNARRSTR